MLGAHRKVPNRAREERERQWANVAQALAGETICGRCGATFATYQDRCEANLGEQCPGAVQIAQANARASR
jgi:hypothetical protein